jgi:hypothetical protein
MPEESPSLAARRWRACLRLARSHSDHFGTGRAQESSRIGNRTPGGYHILYEHNLPAINLHAFNGLTGAVFLSRLPETVPLDDRRLELRQKRFRAVHDLTESKGIPDLSVL